MSILIIPLLGLAATPATIWAITTVADHCHTRNDAQRRELASIDLWLDAIRRT